MPSNADLERTYDRLYAWCEARDLAGWDPFDALNSRVFRATPLKNSRLARFVFTQTIKRSPINLRPLFAVPRGVNAKGIALFALAELSRYRATDEQRHAERAGTLLDKLLSLGIRDGDTLAFGYNFDWQSRAFFAPKGTATIVPTAFASQAFAEGAEAFGDERWAEAVERIAEFAETRLQRPVETDDEICFSYTPLDSSVIYNASLLAAECLMRSSKSEYHDLAARAVNFVVRRQQDNGAWAYGEGKGQDWVDNFHTAYVLVSLKRLSERIGVDVADAIKKGKGYWIDNFFLDDGTPKYYDNKTDPIDIHSAAVAIAAAAELDENDLAARVASWTISNMRDADGSFYYRVGRLLVNQTPFMRWGQAWMSYALARLLEAR